MLICPNSCPLNAAKAPSPAYTAARPSTYTIDRYRARVFAADTPGPDNSHGNRNQRIDAGRETGQQAGRKSGGQGQQRSTLQIEIDIADKIIHGESGLLNIFLRNV